MSLKHIGEQTVCLATPPSIASAACVVGKKEGDGPLNGYFDFISEDSYFGESTWEKAESTMLKQCFSIACDKAGLPPSNIQYLFAGDLLNQCTGTAFGLRESGIPFFGLFGACSTMAEGLALAAMLIDGGFADTVAAMTCSHFCSAERQFRLPLEYGGQRAPTAQWTVTGAGAVILNTLGAGPCVTHVTTGKIVDKGITDAANMGAAMAPAAFETIKAHFQDTGRGFDYYDVVITGDLGKVGHTILRDLFLSEGVDFGTRLMDCGLLIYSIEGQDVHSGGSGCGCAASVLSGHLLARMAEGHWPKILFCGTGALMSATSAMQGESIPGICHAVALEMK